MQIDVIVNVITFYRFVYPIIYDYNGGFILRTNKTAKKRSQFAY